MKLMNWAGVLLIIVTWIVAGLSYSDEVPFFSEWSVWEGLLVSLVLTIAGVVIAWPTKKVEENDN